MEQMAERIKTKVYESVTLRIDKIEGEIHTTNNEIDKYKQRIRKLEDVLHEKDDTIYRIQSKMEELKGKFTEKDNDLEQYSRSNNIKIINLPEEN